jgi:hypothetical protein
MTGASTTLRPRGRHVAPEVPTPVDWEGAPVRSSRRRPLVLAAAAVSAGAVALALALAGGGSERAGGSRGTSVTLDATALLADVQAFVAGTDGVRTTARTESVATSGAAGRGGAQTTTWIRTSSELSFVADEAHVVVHDDLGSSELLLVGGRLYWRDADDEAGLAAERWGEEPVEPGWQEALGGDVELDLPTLIAAATDPELVEGRHDAVTATVDPAALGDLGELVEALDLRLTLDGASPTQVVIEARTDGEVSTMTIDILGWTAPADLVAPRDDAIDPTPSFTEEAIAATGIDLLEPAVLPEGWLLWSADVVSAEHSFEGCEQVALDDEGPGEEDLFTLWQLPATCEGADDNDLIPQVRVGTTIVQIEGGLSEDDLDAVLAHLEPFDPTTMVEPTYEGQA